MALSSSVRAGLRRYLGAVLPRTSAAAVIVVLVASACADATPDTSEPPATPAAAATAEPDSQANATTAAPSPRAHVVTRGQTLAELAREYDVPLADLVEWNQIQDPNLVLVGQVVLLEAAQPQSTQEPLRRAPTETEENDPLLEWARDTWERLPVPDFGITNEGVRSGVTVAFLFLAAGMAALAGLVVLALVRSAFRLVTGRRPAQVEAAPREPMLVYAGGPQSAASGVVPSVQVAAATPAVERARTPATEPVHTAAPVTGPPRPSLDPPAPSTAPVVGAEEAPSARRALTFDILRSPGSKVVAATNGVRRGASGLLAGRQRKDDERRREASLQRWWKHGTETLRIGLLDDAERHFLQGLQEAEQFGWDDEQRLYEEALEHVAERRRLTGAPVATSLAEPSPRFEVDDERHG